MADQWYYTQAGQVRGPVSTDRVRQLLAARELMAEDEVWAETPERAAATEVRKAGELAALMPAPGVPDWLGDVAKAEEPTAATGATTLELDWLADVEIPQVPRNVAVEALPGSVPARTVGAAGAVPPAPRVRGPARLLAGAATSRGMARDRNEDHFLLQHLTWSDGEDSHELALIVVADGLGAHNAGDRASRLAARTVATTMAPVLAGILQNPSREAGAAVLARHLDRAMQDAHAAVGRRAESDPNCKGMGATIAVVLVWDDQAFVRHVGDCRVYHQEEGKMHPVTRDHTVVARMVELGKLTPEEASTHPARNEVTQALGKRGDIEPSQETVMLVEGDWLVICSDGLTTHVDDAGLAQTVLGWQGPPADLAAHLVDLANKHGGTDNCTVVALLYA